MKNTHLGITDRKSTLSKATCHYYGHKDHIGPICHISKVKVPNGTMTWIPKCSLTKYPRPTSRVPKIYIWFYVGMSCLLKKVVVPR